MGNVFSPSSHGDSVKSNNFSVSERNANFSVSGRGKKTFKQELDYLFNEPALLEILEAMYSGSLLFALVLSIR